MELSKLAIESLSSAVDACSLFGIQKFHIHDGKIHAMNDKGTAIIISNLDEFNIEIATHYCSDLKKRLGVFTSPKIDVRMHDKGFGLSLQFTENRTKGEFRLTNPGMLKMPIVIEAEDRFRINEIPQSDVSQITKIARILGSDNTKFGVSIDSKGHVTFTVTDAAGEAFSVELAEKADVLHGEPISANYDAKIAAVLLNKIEGGFIIAESGIIKSALVNNHYVNIIPLEENDDA